MQNSKKIAPVPMRTCTGCGKVLPKIQLIRIAKSKDGQIAVDITGKADGRGAYLCKSEECLTLCKKKKRLNRTFRGFVGEEIYKELSEKIAEFGENLSE